MNIDEEKQTLARLEARLVEATDRATELQTERRRIAFAANTGDAKARKELDKFNAELSTADLEIANVRSAIEEAKRRLAEAEREEALASERTKAARAVEIADSLERRGRKLDEALLALATEAELLEDDLSELNYDIGWKHPSLANFKALIERPFHAGLMFQPSGRTRQDGQPAPGTLKLRHLGPGERMTFQEIADGFAKSIRRTASQILGDRSEAA